MADHPEAQPIIIKKVYKKGHGHHGGAWKVAFADFAIAMMAFFLVLWLTQATTEPEKQAISGYFKDPAGFVDKASVFVVDMKGAALQKEQGASTKIQDDPNDLEKLKSKQQLEKAVPSDKVEELAQQIEQQRFDQVMKEMQRRIEESKELAEYKDQILMSVTPEGLLVQIVDKESRPMFDLGSSRLKPYIYLILKGIVGPINSMPNKISISGHTDALAFQTMQNFTNWELSAERANAARRALVQNGMSEDKVAEVVGLASSRLLDKNNPASPMNRRISILLLSKKSEAELSRRSSSEAPSSGDQGSENTDKTQQKTPLSDEQVTGKNQTVLSEPQPLPEEKPNKVPVEKAEKTALKKQENSVAPVKTSPRSSPKQPTSADDELF